MEGHLLSVDLCCKKRLILSSKLKVKCAKGDRFVALVIYIGYVSIEHEMSKVICYS